MQLLSTQHHSFSFFVFCFLQCLSFMYKKPIELKSKANADDTLAFSILSRIVRLSKTPNGPSTLFLYFVYVLLIFPVELDSACWCGHWGLEDKQVPPSWLVKPAYSGVFSLCSGPHDVWFSFLFIRVFMMFGFGFGFLFFLFGSSWCFVCFEFQVGKRRYSQKQHWI